MSMKTKIKICGITNEKDALAAARAGADYLGFIINVPKSSRNLSPVEAQKIITAVRNEFSKVHCVGVLVDQNFDEANKIIQTTGIDIVQLHGNESPEFCSNLRGMVEVWKTLIIKSAVDLEKIAAYRHHVDKILFDAGEGSGQSIDFDLLAGVPVDILAGGLGLDNIEMAIKKIQPQVVDLNSRLESTLGKKDLMLVKQAISLIKFSDMPKIFFSTKYDADELGYFGEFGASFAPETLMAPLQELSDAYEVAKVDPAFLDELNQLYKNYSGRPTPLYFAENLTRQLNGAKIYLKNEGLNHTGAHKINHCLGQALLAKRMGKKRLIAETGAGQHGLAVATVAARFGFECTVYMGAVDVERQRPNVFWMEQLGAEVVPVEYGTKRLKDAVMAALQDWIGRPVDTYYLLGSALGPHPYPSMVRDFQSIIGLEVKEQIQMAEGRMPDYLVACVGGGSNAIGLFNCFLDNPDVKMIGVEAGGRGIKEVGDHAARLQGQGKVGIVEGYKSYFLTDDDGQIQPTHSISAGLDYSGIGPEHSALFKAGRVVYHYATDSEVLGAFKTLAKTEGIFSALESAHAMAEAIKLAPTLSKDKIIVVNISGRGDKDIFIVAEALHDKKWKDFLRTKI